MATQENSYSTEELILVHLDTRTGDIRNVEQQTGDGKKTLKKRDSVAAFKGLRASQSFGFSRVRAMGTEPLPAFCCKVAGRCVACSEVVIVAFTYNSRTNDFAFRSLNSVEEDKLKELEEIQIDHSTAVTMETQCYDLVAVESPEGPQIWLIDQNEKSVRERTISENGAPKKPVWR